MFHYFFSEITVINSESLIFGANLRIELTNVLREVGGISGRLRVSMFRKSLKYLESVIIFLRNYCLISHFAVDSLVFTFCGIFFSANG